MEPEKANSQRINSELLGLFLKVMFSISCFSKDLIVEVQESNFECFFSVLSTNNGTTTLAQEAILILFPSVQIEVSLMELVSSLVAPVISTEKWGLNPSYPERKFQVTTASPDLIL